MSVGHVARAFEDAGIPTVAIFVRAFRHVAEDMRLPRTVVTRHPMGRPLGAPGDRARQQDVIEAALDLLDAATQNGSIVELGSPWRPGTITGRP